MLDPEYFDITLLAFSLNLSGVANLSPYHLTLPLISNYSLGKAVSSQLDPRGGNFPSGFLALQTKSEFTHCWRIIDPTPILLRVTSTLTGGERGDKYRQQVALSVI